MICMRPRPAAFFRKTFLHPVPSRPAVPSRRPVLSARAGGRIAPAAGFAPVRRCPSLSADIERHTKTMTYTIRAQYSGHGSSERNEKMCETETRYFWKLAAALRDAKASGNATAISESVDDLEVIAMHGAPRIAAQAQRLADTARHVVAR